MEYDEKYDLDICINPSCGTVSEPKMETDPDFDMEEPTQDDFDALQVCKEYHL